MNDKEKKIIKAVQHLTNTARLKAYKCDDYEKIAVLLDQVDHVLNLVQEEWIDFDRIQRVLDSVAESFPECSREILSGE